MERGRRPRKVGGGKGEGQNKGKRGGRNGKGMKGSGKKERWG